MIVNSDLIGKAEFGSTYQAWLPPDPLPTLPVYLPQGAPLMSGDSTMIEPVTDYWETVKQTLFPWFPRFREATLKLIFNQVMAPVLSNLWIVVLAALIAAWAELKENIKGALHCLGL